MANENLAVLSASQLSGLDEDDYRSFCAALRASARGRAFLGEYARRNRHTDTEVVLEALARLERTARNQAIPSEGERIRQDLRALLNTLHAARPQLDSSPGAIKAATLTSLIDFVQARIEALLMPNRQPLSQVPTPEQPELPIPRPSSMNPPPIALVQGGQTAAPRSTAAAPERSRPASGFDLTMLDLSRLLLAPLEPEADRQPSMFDSQPAAPRAEQAPQSAPAQTRSTLSLLDMALVKPQPLDLPMPAAVAQDSKSLAIDTRMQKPQGLAAAPSTAEPYELWLDQNDNQPTSTNALADAQANELANAQIAALAAALLRADARAEGRVEAPTELTQAEVRAEPQVERATSVRADASIGLPLDLGLSPSRQSAIDSIAYARSNAPVTLDIDLDFDTSAASRPEAATQSQPAAQADSSADQATTSYSDLLVAPPANLLVSVLSDTSDDMPVEASLEAIAEAMAEAQAAVEARTEMLAEPVTEPMAAVAAEDVVAETVAELPTAAPVEMHAEEAMAQASESTAETTVVAAAELLTAETAGAPAVVEPQTEAVSETPVEAIAALQTAELQTVEAQSVEVGELQTEVEAEATTVAEMPAEAVAELQTADVAATQAEIMAEATAEPEVEAATPTTSLVARAAALAELATDSVAVDQTAWQDQRQDEIQNDDAQDDFQGEAEFSLAGDLSAASQVALQAQTAAQQAADEAIARPAAENVSEETQDALAPIMELSEEERIALFT